MPTSPVCDRCPPKETTVVVRETTYRYTTGARRKVDVAFWWRGEMLCPTHTIEAVEEDGWTLDEAIVGRKGD